MYLPCNSCFRCSCALQTLFSTSKKNCLLSTSEVQTRILPEKYQKQKHFGNDLNNNCIEYFLGGIPANWFVLHVKRRTCLKVARLMRLKGNYFVLAPKVEPSLIGSWRIWKIGKFCVLKGAVNLWCSAQRDRLSEGRVHQYISHLTFVIFYFFDCFPFKQCDTLKTIRRGFHV